MVVAAFSLLAVLVSGCDSASPDAVTADATVSGSTKGLNSALRFRDRASFLQAVEAAKLTFSGKAEVARPALSPSRSLYAAQQDPTEAELATGVPDIPDPALASILDASGSVFIGNQRFQFGMDALRTYDASGALGSVTPATVRASSEVRRATAPGAAARSTETLYPEVYTEFGLPVAGGHLTYRMHGELWFIDYGVYASSGAKTEHQRLKKVIFRGWYYGDDDATYIRVECRNADTGGFIGATERTNTYDVVSLYFDSGLFGTGNDVDARITCDHQSSDRVSSSSYSGYGSTERLYVAP